MKIFLLSFLALTACNTSSIIFDFNKTSNIGKWLIVDDVVMGGKSSGTFSLDTNGHGVFAGVISLENNGGFSSVRYSMEKNIEKKQTKIRIRLKGDGKQYQFRIKSNSKDYYSYITSFNTSGEWQEIVIPLKDMYPSFRGRKLDRPNFSKSKIEEIAFLIGNKKQETFVLHLDKIALE